MNEPTGSTNASTDQLQDGIYFRPGERPGQCYRLLLLNIREGTPSPDAKDAIASIWTMLQNLRQGIVRDLQPTRPSDPDLRVPTGGLTCLLGFGARLFNPSLHVPQLVATEQKPRELVSLRSNGNNAPFSKLLWTTQDKRKPGEADLAIQCIAETELAVNRAVVEVWKLIVDQNLPLDVVTFHGGFNRDDHRSWIDFHDGVNNLRSGDERRQAIEVVVADPPWMKGGTYMASLRIAVDVASWRRLPREHQEVIVGRDKLTGCPLQKVSKGANGELIPVLPTGCPMTGTVLDSPAFRNPSQASDPLVKVSHIHRSNLIRGRPDTDSQNRIFRQGYEFLEVLGDGQLSLGLHFVSFQRKLQRLTDILRLDNWLKDVNFGGPVTGEPPAIGLMSVIAGGFYAVPPKGEPFPGADLF